MSKVRYNNRGYIGQSKSVRAAQAEENGLLPLSRITRKKGIAERLASLGIEPAEWHHTGKYARKTDYWRVATVRAIAAMSGAEFAAAVQKHEFRLAHLWYRSHDFVGPMSDVSFRKYKIMKRLEAISRFHVEGGIK